MRHPLYDFFMTRYMDAYAVEIAAFVRSIIDKSVPVPSGRDGEAALVLAEGALLSVVENRLLQMAAIQGAAQ